MLKRRPKADDVLIHRWWTAMELWYNFSDRYDVAMDLMIDAIQDYVFLQQDVRNNEDEECDHMYDSADYGIDSLELKWKSVLNQAEDLDSVPEQTLINIENDIFDNKWSIVVIQLLIFVAGMCLDASNIATARRCLFHAILQLLSLISMPRTSEELSQMNGLHDKRSVFKFLASALQEYITSYEEDQEQEIPHWLVARRIATLRSLTTPSHRASQMSSSESSDEPQQWFWNPDSAYQRPPYYIHYPYFLRNSEKISKVFPASIVPRRSHPLWCSQLEQHTSTIQKEFEKLMIQSPAASRNFQSQCCYVDDDHYKSESAKQFLPMHWPKVGAGNHRNGTGMHDSSVVRDGGDWRELVLFSANCTTSGIESHSIAPQTKRLIRQFCSDEVLSLVETGIGEVIFSVLAPHTHILPHTASHNVRYTAHLPLRIPKHESSDASHSEDSEKPACYIRVGNEVCTWKVGQMLVFDDSYEHEVVNSTDEIRGLLLIRFWHPLLSRTSDRERAIQWVQKEQNDDRCKRFNPPVPPQLYGEHASINQRGAVTARGMEQTLCPSCELTGYTSIRCNQHQRQFVCVCGAII
jgi:Aspartyl/Asparaginyl beta-hydroxylase